MQKPWTYFGVVVFPAGVNGSGVRWSANAHVGYTLRADSKESMRQLIRDTIKKEKRG